MLFDSTVHSFLDMFTGNDKQRLDVSVGKTKKIGFIMTPVG